jgi:hypothetical protein
MARKSSTYSRLLAAKQAEQREELAAALDLYGKVTAGDPLQAHAWHRQMVILPKLKKPQQELRLIEKAIASYRQGIRDDQGQWIQANRDKVENSRALAKTLGLVDSDGLPNVNDEVTPKWAQRQALLQTRQQKRSKQTVRKEKSLRAKKK